MSTPTQLRDRDFIRLCQRRLSQLRSEGISPSLYRIVSDVLSKPAPSYYVDYYHASRQLRLRLLRTGAPPMKNQSSVSLWDDFARDYKELHVRHPSRTFHELILDLCVGNAGHPRFYLSPRRAMEIVRRHLDGI